MATAQITNLPPALPPKKKPSSAFCAEQKMEFPIFPLGSICPGGVQVDQAFQNPANHREHRGSGSAQQKRPAWNEIVMAPLPRAAGLSGMLTGGSIYDLAWPLAIANDQIPSIGMHLIYRLPSYVEPVGVRTIHPDPSPIGSQLDFDGMQTPDDLGEGCVCRRYFSAVIVGADAVMRKHEVARRRNFGV